VTEALRTKLPGVRIGLVITAAVTVHIIAAWFNGGFFGADEHYQIIELAQYKLGRLPASALAWEFAAHARPALQPWLAAGLIKACLAAGVTSPFLMAFALRLLSTLLALWASLELSARCLPAIKEQSLKLAALTASLFLWIAPTVHGRFSSENWGGALLVAGLCLMLDTAEAWAARRARAVVLAVCTGLVWSAAFYCRFQVGLAIAGAGFWLVFPHRVDGVHPVRRAPLELVTLIGASFVAFCGLNELLDHWMYGSWMLGPYSYFEVQVVQGKAALFGVSPWWMLAVYMVLLLIPPYSIAVLALFVVGSWYARRDVLVWVTAPFLIAHAVLAHKEPRFLIPLLYVAGPLFAVCVNALPGRLSAPLFTWSRTRVGRANIELLCGANLVLLVIMIFVPAHETYRLYRWLWDQSRDRRIMVYTIGGSPYALSGATNSFYRSENVSLQPIDTAEQLRDAIAAGAETPAFMYYKGLQPPALVAAAAGACAPVLRTFPVWLPRFDYFHWLKDAQLATICRLGPKAIEKYVKTS
jgi:phosphatidylinositol glycan class B